MATQIYMSHPKGMSKAGAFGFSFTYLAFGPFVPMFRGEIAIAALHTVLGILTLGMSNILFAFVYNRQYMLRQIQQGWRLDDNPDLEVAAERALGLIIARYRYKSVL